MIYVISLTVNLLLIHPVQKAQITLLVIKEVKILTKYSDFLDVFLKEKVLILLKTTELNQCAIKLQKDQQSLYRLIYSLGLVKLKTLKSYIKINLANGFIEPLKSTVSAFILFVKKPDSSLRLCIDYQGF